MNYRLTIQIPFICSDDIEARKEANDFINNLNLDKSMIDKIKFQEIKINEQPRKVEL